MSSEPLRAWRPAQHLDGDLPQELHLVLLIVVHAIRAAATPTEVSLASHSPKIKVAEVLRGHLALCYFGHCFSKSYVAIGKAMFSHKMLYVLV